jgi:hypothetical protein
MPGSGPWSDKVAALLTEFPGPVILHPSGLKWVGIAVVSAFLEGCSVLFLSPLFPHLAPKELVIVGGVLLTPVVFLMAVAALTLGRDLPRVMLDAEEFETRGFETRRYAWRHRQRWSEVTQFRPFLLLAIHFDTRLPHGSWDKFARAYLGGDARVWFDTFGLGAKNFARLMNAWRERALTQQRV